jgi:hypothetical protein
MNYKNKYLKYKNKYLMLKHKYDFNMQIGGSSELLDVSNLDRTIQLKNVEEFKLDSIYIYNNIFYILNNIELEILDIETNEIIKNNDYMSTFELYLYKKIDYNYKSYFIINIILQFGNINEEETIIVDNCNENLLSEIKEFDFIYIDTIDDFTSESKLVNSTLDYRKNQDLITQINNLSSSFMKEFFKYDYNGSNYILLFSMEIESNRFGSLYKIINGKLCLNKEKNMLISYLKIFNQFTEINLFPKMTEDFHLFRFEYLINYDF